MQEMEPEFQKVGPLYLLMLVYPSKRQRHKAHFGQSGHKGAQVSKKASSALG